MKITQDLSFDLEDATQDFMYYLKDCRGQTVIMNKEDSLTFITHPLTDKYLEGMKFTIKGINFEVRD